MLATMIHLNRGTPYIYMGEEIGMIDPDYSSISDYIDVESLNAYKLLLEQGFTEKKRFVGSKQNLAITLEHPCNGQTQNKQDLLQETLVKSWRQARRD